MPKNTLIPAPYGGGVVPPVPERSILFDRTRQTLLHGYTPPDSIGAGAWQVSFWFKQTGDIAAADRTLFSAYIDANNYTRLYHSSSGEWRFEAVVAGVVEAQFRTFRRMMDTSGWFHCSLIFIPSLKLEFYLNGVLWNQYIVAPTIANIAGYAWLDQNADHGIGGNAAPQDWWSGCMAEFVCNSGLTYLMSSFMTFSSAGVLTYKPFTDTIDNNGRGFLLTFGRTADLGEDFSGNGNDFTLHDNAAPAGGDQFAEWPERNYCIIDVNNDGTVLGPVNEGGLDLVAGAGRVTFQPAANTGVWYYEKDGVAVTWDTGVSGRFNPALTPGVFNFGQKPFQDVGPGGGELTLCSPNLPASSVAISRDHFSAIGYEGDGTSPRLIISPLVSQGNPEYNQINGRRDWVWVRNMSAANNQQASHRLRPIPNQMFINLLDNETASLPDGYISDLPAIAGFEVTAGGATDNNVNNTGDLYSASAWRVSKYAQNLVIIQMDDNAEEEVDNPASGNTDTSSSDLELVLEGADPEQEVGLRYQNVLIPQGATVVEARIQFEADDTNAGANDLLIFTEDIDDAPVFIDAAANFNITLRTKATPGIPWAPAAWNVTQERAAPQLTPDISARVQDVIDRLGWAAGNSLVIIFTSDPAGTLGEREAEAWNAVGGDSDRNTAMLQVAWDDGGVDTGMSLFTYVGAGKASQIMHGLDAVPEFFMVKKVTGGLANWYCYHSLIQPPDLINPEDGWIAFNSGSGATAATIWNNTPPDATYISLDGGAFTNEHEEEYLGMAMREIEGYSKLFNYTGNGAIGPFIYCGFKPRWIIIKETGPGGNNWFFGHRAMGNNNPPVDGIYNQLSGNMYLNSTINAVNDDNLSIHANGLRILDNTGPINNLNSRYVGMAFAEVPLNISKGAE